MYITETLSYLSSKRVSGEGKLSKQDIEKKIFDSFRNKNQKNARTTSYSESAETTTPTKTDVKKPLVYTEEKVEKAFELAQQDWMETAERAFEIAKEDFIEAGEKILKKARKDWEKGK